MLNATKEYTARDSRARKKTCQVHNGRGASDGYGIRLEPQGRVSEARTP
jgi:hypothetical protein